MIIVTFLQKIFRKSDTIRFSVYFQTLLPIKVGIQYDCLQKMYLVRKQDGKSHCVTTPLNISKQNVFDNSSLILTFPFQSSTPKKPESNNQPGPSCFIEPDFPCCSTSPIVPNPVDQTDVRRSLNQTEEPVSTDETDHCGPHYNAEAGSNLSSNGSHIQTNPSSEFQISHKFTDQTESTVAPVQDIPVCSLVRTSLPLCVDKLANDSPAVLQVEVTKF